MTEEQIRHYKHRLGEMEMQIVEEKEKASLEMKLLQVDTILLNN